MDLTLVQRPDSSLQNTADSVATEGGQSWPQPPFKAAEGRLRAELPAPRESFWPSFGGPSLKKNPSLPFSRLAGFPSHAGAYLYLNETNNKMPILIDNSWRLHANVDAG
jgi:hypothetical protein